MKTRPLLIQTHARATLARTPAPDDAIECDMATNATLNGRPRVVSRQILDVLVCVLCLIILTLATGWMLVHAGIGQVAYPLRVSTSSNRELNALLGAIEQNDVPAARRVLRKRRFDVNTADNQGLPPINYALFARGAGANELVDLLIAAGADVNGRGSDRGVTPPLLSAATLRRPDLVKQLLNAGADVERALPYGWTALHFAAGCGDSETVAMLLAAGANPDAVNDEGDTPLAVALANGLPCAAAAAALMAPSRFDRSPPTESQSRRIESVRRTKP